MHRADILASIKKTGSTITQVSIEAGLSPSACSKALSVRFPAAEQAISRRLNLPLHVIWPARYHEDGSRKTGQRPYATRALSSKDA